MAEEGGGGGDRRDEEYKRKGKAIMDAADESPPANPKIQYQEVGGPTFTTDDETPNPNRDSKIPDSNIPPAIPHYCNREIGGVRRYSPPPTFHWESKIPDFKYLPQILQFYNSMFEPEPFSDNKLTEGPLQVSEDVGREEEAKKRKLTPKRDDDDENEPKRPKINQHKDDTPN